MESQGLRKLIMTNGALSLSSFVKASSIDSAPAVADALRVDIMGLRALGLNALIVDSSSSRSSERGRSRRHLADDLMVASPMTPRAMNTAYQYDTPQSIFPCM